MKSTIVGCIILVIFCIGCVVGYFYDEHKHNQARLLFFANNTVEMIGKDITAIQETQHYPEVRTIDEPLPEITETTAKDITENRKITRPGFFTLQSMYKNDDIVATLNIPGTNIEHEPVVQTENNNYYLYHNLDRQPDKAGAIFMDYENNIASEDKNIIIYGHNMKNKTMFQNLHHFKDKSFYQEHKYITLGTAYEVLEWEIFSVFVTDTDFYYIQVFFNSNEEFIELTNQMKAKSLYETDISVDPDDRILTLSTCDSGGTKRLVVSAKLVNTLK